MSSRRKISVRKVIQTLVTFIVAAGSVLAILSADRLQRNKKVKSVRVHIRNAKAVRFLDEEEVMRLLFTNRHLDPEQMTLAQLDIRKMEAIARTNPWVRDAQVYVDNERNLNIYLEQRVPVVRVFEWDGNSYYIDSALQAMPLSDRYAHYTPVVTNVRPLREDSVSRDTKGRIFSLVRYITAHKFWNAQIAQIELMPDQSFRLIPVLGTQRILFGDTARMEEKFNHLYAFYHQVLNKVGWDKYETLDLRFDGQVVAAPSLPWKAPVDRALSNINWVKAIMDAGPKEETDEAAGNVSDSAGSTAATPAVPLPVKQAPAKPAAGQAVPPKPKAAPPAVTRKAALTPVKKPAPASAAPKKLPKPPAKAATRKPQPKATPVKGPARPEKAPAKKTNRNTTHTTSH